MRLPFLLATLVALAACHTAGEPEREAELRSGLDIAGFDPAIRPQDDFFLFANGHWMRDTGIPSDRADYGSFTQLADEAEDHLLEILAELDQLEQVTPGSPEQLIRDFHRSLLDRDTANAAGIAPLQPQLDAIDTITSHHQVWLAFPRNLALAAGAPLAGFVGQDAHDATRYVFHLSQSGLSLPDRDYYLESGDRYVQSRELLADYAARLFELAGFDHPVERAETIVALETRLAEAQWSRVENRNPVATYNPLTPQTLAATAPGAPWPEMLATLELPDIDRIVVRQPSYLEALDDIVPTVDVAVWRDWLRFRLLSAYADWLDDDFFAASFAYHQQGLRGVPESRPLERRALQVLNSRVGMALGQLYVERHFKPEAKARMETMVANLKTAFRHSLETLEWMTSETRHEALGKLDSFTTKIGYPDVWRDYHGLEIHADDLVGNLVRSAEFEYRRNLDRLGQPVDREEWFMTPQTVNAYYNSRMNEIVFPAAILQPPFFDLDADDAVNYGGIGAVIGHELGHGFDDSGRQSDGDGNLRDWWTEKDAAEYNARADRLVEQYGRYNPIDNMYVDGRLTLGENIGDLGGLTIAWRAYQLALNGQQAPVLDGYTGAQRFFLGWAQIWRRMYQDEELRRRLRTDTHSPARYRVNGVVVNIPAFYDAFDVQPGDGMWLDEEERVAIW